MNKQEVLDSVKDGLELCREHLTSPEVLIMEEAIRVLDGDPQKITLEDFQRSIRSVKKIHKEQDIQTFPGSIFNAKNGRVALTDTLLCLLRSLSDPDIDPRIRIHPKMIIERCSKYETVTMVMAPWLPREEESL